MDDRNLMIRLIRDAVGGTTDYWAGLIADNLIANGFGFIMRTPIETLDLGLRAYHALKRAGIDTVEELQAMDEEQLARLRGIGATILNEILTKRGGNNEN